MSSSSLSPAQDTPAPVVVLRQVSKQFGRFAALRAITAEFRPGRFYAILGDNGAGKTTLLRVLAGLVRPTRGGIKLLGQDDLHAAAGQLGYMAHPSLLYDELSALENLRYFARLYGIRDDERCRSVITQVGLDPGLTRRVGQYSQGMRQRLSLARALVHDPALLLLDEPFSNVDAGSARAMTRLLGSLRDSGKTIFLVTHQVLLLEGVADEFLRMAAGQITTRTPQLAAAMLTPFPPGGYA